VISSLSLVVTSPRGCSGASGIPLTGLSAGLVSSTAVTLAFARQA